jgi:hypothetical protein
MPVKVEIKRDQATKLLTLTCRSGRDPVPAPHLALSVASG